MARRPARRHRADGRRRTPARGGARRRSRSRRRRPAGPRAGPRAPASPAAAAKRSAVVGVDARRPTPRRAPRSGPGAPARRRARRSPRRVRRPAARPSETVHGRPSARPGASTSGSPVGTSGSRNARLRCTGPAGGPAASATARAATARHAGRVPRAGPILGRPDLAEPPDGVAVELQLVDGLARARVAELGRPVRGAHDQRDASRGAPRAPRDGSSRPPCPRCTARPPDGPSPWPSRVRRTRRNVRRGGRGDGCGRRRRAPAPAASSASRARPPRAGRRRAPTRRRTRAPVRCWRRGSCEDDPVRVVLVHGFTQTSSSWDPVVAQLAARRRLQRARGSGRSRLRDDRGDDRRGAAVTRPTSATRWAVGCACMLALDRPDLVERLVLVSASPGIADAERARSASRAATSGSHRRSSATASSPFRRTLARAAAVRVAAA